MITKNSYETRLSVRQMFFKNLFLLFFIFIGAQQVNAQRAMYVTLAKQTSWSPNEWSSTIFDDTGEVPDELIKMLEYARDNNFTYLILYKVREVIEAGHTLGLVNFMNLAKDDYCITKLGVNAASGSIIGYKTEDYADSDPSNDILLPYNSNDDLITPFNTLQEAKFDALVFEDEFWNDTDNDEDPATPDVYPSFEVYIQILDKMNEMKATVEGISSVDVYLFGKTVSSIFEDINTNNPSNLLTPKQNANRVDNRADNIFITVYKNEADPTDVYGTYTRFKPTAIILGNTNEIATATDPLTVSKPGTKIFPLIAVNGSLDENGDFGGDIYCNAYFETDPTLSANRTPFELENDLVDLIDLESNLADQSIIKNQMTSDGFVWFKYEFLPKPNNYPGHYDYNIDYYNANSILFSSNPTKICNQVTFDYSGPNEDGIEYTWDFGDGSQAVTGVTSASNQLESTSDNTHVYAENGTYTVSLTLVYPGGCSYTYSIDYELIITGNIPELNVSSTNVTDCDYNDGAVEVEILSNSNFGPFTYLWNDENNSTTSSIINLPMNEYIVKVTNNQGCVAFGSTVIGNGMNTFRPNGYHVELGANETWSSTTAMPILMLKGVVYIDFGATLTIDNATVQFAYDVIEDNDEEELTGARFQVNEGGTLNIINSTLTGCNDGIWDGIETRGNNTNNSSVYLNNVTVKNAKIGFTNDRRRNFQKNLVVGGKIQAQNSSFINNRLAVEIKNDNSLSFFKNCNFKYNEATLFNYPSSINCCEWKPKEMTFVHLERGVGTRFESNTFETVEGDFDVTERGTAIVSDKASYKLQTIGGTGSGNNIFLNFRRGLKNYESTIIAEGNTFNNVLFGITNERGSADVIKNNSFNNIPNSDNINNSTYGIFMIGSSGFNISENNFAGSASLNATSFGSHGIAFDKSSVQGGLCFKNNFKGTDYGIHAQGNNLNLKIRCNVFSQDGTDHNVSGFYIYNGVMRDQGNTNCAQNAAQAAGNTWLGPKDQPGESIQSYANQSFTYYANPGNVLNFPVTFPSLHEGNIVVPASYCINSTSQGGDCVSSTAGIGVVGSASWFQGVFSLLDKNRTNSKYYKSVYDFIKSNPNDSTTIALGNYDSLLNVIRTNIEWEINEAQLLENELIQAYVSLNMFNEFEEMLLESQTAESYKILSSYYFKSKNFEKCRAFLYQIVDITKNEVNYLDKFKRDLILDENNNFVEYTLFMVELAEKNQSIYELDNEQLELLKKIAASNTQIAISAMSDLNLIENSNYETLIMKRGSAKSLKKEIVHESALENNFTVYPNPSSGLINVRYELNKDSENCTIIIYDALGKIRKTVSIAENTNEYYTIDCSSFTNGIYTFVMVSDKKVLGTKKLVIIK